MMEEERGACCRRGLRHKRGGVARRQRSGAWERGEGGGRMGAVRTGARWGKHGDGEGPRETGLILRCAGKAGNPFQTTQG